MSSSSRWLKAVPSAAPETAQESQRAETPNVSMSDVRRLAQEKAARAAEEQSSASPLPYATGQPVNQPVVNQSTTLDNQLTTPALPLSSDPLVNQLTSQPASYTEERFYRSRRERRLKGIRLPVSNLERYELWCLLNKVDFQDAVDFAMNWLTSQPVNQLTGQPANQLTTLINNDLNNELVINDEKAKKAFAKYTELTGKPITQKDQEAYREVAHLDFAVIASGLETAIRRAAAAGSKVNSFRYANNCILEIGKLSAQSHSAAASGASEAADASQCPDCSGTGFWYPEGPERGVAKCSHKSLREKS